MPWKIEPRGDEFCVVREADGEVEGCHETRDEADAQLSALYATEATTDSVDALKSLEVEKQARFKRYTYNGVTAQATGRRSSDRDSKAWMRTVRSGDKERTVHYADPDMPMRRNNPGARKNFLARHNCDGKKDPFAPGFWACYDWANPNEKETTMDQEKRPEMETKAGDVKEKMMGMDGPTSFAEYEAMVEAMDSAAKVQDLARMFRVMVDNIMLHPDVEDKGAAVQSLAGEFAERVDDTVTRKSLDDLVLKERHYKEVVEDAGKATKIDFGGGCQHCGFGDTNLSKEVRDCPYCWGELGVAR